jgi:hypothetical protein
MTKNVTHGTSTARSCSRLVSAEAEIIPTEPSVLCPQGEDPRAPMPWTAEWYLG